MTEAEWLVAVNAQKMIAALSGKGSERLWRLFAVACCRRFEHRMRNPRSRRALDVAEQFADGLATVQELKAAHANAEQAAHEAFCDAHMDEVRANFQWDAGYEAMWAAKEAADAAVQCVAEELVTSTGGQTVVIAERLQFPDMLREVFGNPFRWTLINPNWIAWNDGAVRKIAQATYDERAFDRMPILADALEDAGCGNADILRHCREPGEHVRGCWVIDLLLGKE